MQFPGRFSLYVPPLTVTAVIDILVVAVVIYRLLQIVRGTRAAHVLAGILTVVIVYQVALRAGLETLRTLIESLVPYTAIAIIVLFQSEIRRTLARLGRKQLFGGYERAELVDEILLALTAFSREKTGALIVLERDIGLRTFIESGVRLDAQISRDLLLTVFHENTSLHDGAAILQKDRIAAAACFLPLSVNPALATQLGTRHRAAIGITEETDCLSLVVSEETGAISVAAFGQLERDVTIERVEQRIAEHFGAARRPKRPARPEARREQPEEAVARMD